MKPARRVFAMYVFRFVFRQLFIFQIIGMAPLETEDDHEVARCNLTGHLGERVLLVIKRLLEKNRLHAYRKKTPRERLDKSDLGIDVGRDRRHESACAAIYRDIAMHSEVFRSPVNME